MTLVQDPKSLASRIPSPPELERRCIALAMLDAILSPEWEYRYYSFNQKWDPEGETRMASMRNGAGDEDFILFFPDGTAAMKGFDHESPALEGRMSIPEVLDGLPPRFRAFATEPAFSMDRTTFCLWNAGDGWSRSSSVTAAVIVQNGSTAMLRHVVGTAADYVEYAREYFEVDVPLEVVERFLLLEPLGGELVRSVRPDADLSELVPDVEEIGYPLEA